VLHMAQAALASYLSCMTYFGSEQSFGADAGRCQHRRLPEGCGGDACPGRVLDRPDHTSNARSSCSPLRAATSHVGSTAAEWRARWQGGTTLYSLDKAVAIGHMKPLRCAALHLLIAFRISFLGMPWQAGQECIEWFAIMLRERAV